MARDSHPPGVAAPAAAMGYIPPPAPPPYAGVPPPMPQGYPYQPPAPVRMPMSNVPMGGRGVGGAVLVGLAVAGVAALAAWWLLRPPAGSPTLTANGVGGSITITEGATPSWEIQGTAGDQVEMWWSLSSTGIVGGSGSANPFSGVLNPEGQAFFAGGGIVSPTGSYPATFYVQAIDVTSGLLSNVLAVTVTQPSANCGVGYVACYANGSQAGCCPSGDSCQTPWGSGVCPSGTSPDAANPGCCAPSTSGLRYPASYNAPSQAYIDVQVCQPVCNDLLCEGCCGTPQVTGLSTTLSIQVLDQNGAPLTGVTMLWQWQAGTTSNGVVLDANSYVTDGNGYIYPTISFPSNLLGTKCSGGNYNVASATLQFGEQGGPTGSALCTIPIQVTEAVTTPLGSLGSCGSCP